MANPSSAVDLHQSAAAFEAANEELYALKVNRLARWLPIDSRARAVAQWANLVDDFMLEAQTLLRLQRNGSGSPEGAVAGEVGTLYLNTEASPSGSRLWVKATGTGTTGWSQVGGLEPGDVTLDLLADVAANTVLGNPTGSSGAVQAFACTAAGRALIDDADAPAQRATLGSTTVGDAVFVAANAAAARTALGLVTIASSGSASDLSTGTLPAARFDDTAHGARAGGTTHAVVVAAGAAGFMSGADKTKLDTLVIGPDSVAYEVDFSTLANNTITDGAETIDGLAWVGINTASAGTIAVQNGTGIRITPATSTSATAFTSSSVLVPGVYTTLGALPGFSPDHDWIVEVYLSTIVLEQSGEAALLGLWGVAGSPTTAAVQRVRVAGIRSNPTTFSPRLTDGTNVIISDEVITTHNVIAMRVNANGQAHCLTGVYSGGWPSVYNIGLMSPALAPQQGPMNHSNVRLMLAISQASDASVTTTVVFNRLRLRRA